MQRNVRHVVGRRAKPGKNRAKRNNPKAKRHAADSEGNVVEYAVEVNNASTAETAQVVAQPEAHNSMNTVDVDVAALTAEAVATVDAAEPLPGEEATRPDIIEPAMESWKPVVASVVPMLRIGVLPQWDLSDDECNGFAESLGECLDQAFPGGMNGKYACWARLLIIVTAIPATRYIQHGKLPPLGPKMKAVSNEASATSTQAKPQTEAA